MIYVVIQFSCIIYLILNAQPENLATLEYWLLAIAVVIGHQCLEHINTSRKVNIIYQTFSLWNVPR
jgi:hypothetical protein